MSTEPKQPEIHFFVGKGGVGKSTTSALTALHLSQGGRNTLLVSMDPAHNQCDLFECEFSERTRKVTETLAAKEVDADYWVRRTLKETHKQIQKTYAYESAFNLQKHFKVIKFSPGLEEHALLMAFENILAQAKTLDVIVFDMAPTALSMRFFSLPGISLIWLEELLSLRKLIYRKKEIVSKIRLGKITIEQDRVKQKLKDLHKRNIDLKARFMDKRTHVHLVMNSDRLSLAEALRIRGRLSDMEMAMDRVVVNKLKPGERVPEIEETFGRDRVVSLPLAQGDLVGKDALEKYLHANAKALEAFENKSFPVGA